MSIAGQCPGCSRKFNAPDQYAGKSVKCPQCGQAFVMGAATGVSFALAPTAGPAAPVRSAPPASAAVASRGSSKGLLIIGGIVAAGFFLLAGTVVVGGVVWYYWGGGAASQWKEFAPKDGGFTVLMPGAPTQKDKSDPKISAATPIHEAVARPSGSKVSYSVQYYDLGGAPINDYLYLSWLKNNSLADGGKLAEEHEIKPEPYYGGKEIVVRLPDNQVMVRRLYLAEARVFWLTAQYPDGPVPPAEIRKFLDSFKITSVAKVDRATTAVAEAPKPKKKESGTTKKSGPPVTKKETDPPVAPPKAPDLPMPPKEPAAVSAEEEGVVQAINRYRAGKKLGQLTIDKKLAEAARASATARAEGKVAIMPDDLGYAKTFIQPFTVQGLGVAQFLDLILKQNPAFGNRMADPDMQAIGVGIATAKDGRIHCILLFGGKPK